MDFNDETGEPKKKRTRTIHRAVKPTVGAQFRGVDSGAVKKVLENCPDWFKISLKWLHLDRMN